MEKITSLKNPAIARMRDLKNAKTRRETRTFLVEGEVMIREALKCGLAPLEAAGVEEYTVLLETLENTGARTMLVPASVLESVCETRTPQGVCASFEQPEPAGPDSLPDRIVALDGVQDPGNTGTIWRTADAAGFQALLLGSGCCDPCSSKVIRAAMGSAFRIPYAYTENLAEELLSLRRQGYRIVVSDLSGNDFYARGDLGERFVLVIGNEARGISEEVRRTGDVRVRLPMRGGAESLNAAVAAGIMMYEMMRGR